MGDTRYCTQGSETQVGLSAAIGGCGTRMVDHTNAIASLARLGVYKPHTSVLEVKNTAGQILTKYEDEQKQVIDPQAAYIVSEILGDSNARRGLFGRSITPELDAARIKASIKTGTSDIDRKPKDIWTVGYTPSISMSVWLGNPDTKPLTNGNSSIPARILDPVMTYATQLYQQQGTAKAGEWFTAPQGIQNINGELYPSYYNKNSANNKQKLTFDTLSKKRATDCTPQGARTEIEVNKSTDPVTKQDVFIAPDGYDASKNDDVHDCADKKPEVTAVTVTGSRITVQVSQGKFSLERIDVSVDGQSAGSVPVTSSGSYDVPFNFTKDAAVTVTVYDTGRYTGTGSKTYSTSGAN